MTQNVQHAAGETHLAEFGRRAVATSDALRALSHEHRLMILSLLFGRERSVGELEQILRLPQPAVSQQLARLRLDDLVSCRRSGRTIYYTTECARLEAIWHDLGTLIGRIADPVVAFPRLDAEISRGLTLPQASQDPAGEPVAPAPASVPLAVSVPPLDTQDMSAAAPA